MYSSLLLKNQFGEESNNFVLGGSSQLQASFVVAPADSGGLGITGLVALGISSVYMHTSATPSAGNPNPASGYIVVNFAQGYSSFVYGNASIAAPNSGSSILVTAGLSVGTPYVITILGTTTAAAWQALGLPTNVTPALGQAFVAKTATVGTGTGAVQVQAAVGSGLNHIEVIGNPSASVVTNSGGGSLILACLAATNSSTTTLVPTAPAVGSTIRLSFNMIAASGPLI